MHPPSRTGWTAFSSFWAALIFAAILSFAALGSHSIWSPDEPTGAAIGRAMLDGGDLIVPRLNGQPFLEKPALYWWVQVAAFRLFGVSDAVARVPSALFAVLAMMVVWAMGRRLGGPREGFLAAAVLGTTLLFVQDATRVTVDPALLFFVALAHLGFVLLVQPRSPADLRRARLLIAVAIPLAFLTKGVVAVGLGAGPPILYLLATRRVRALRELLPLTVIGVPVFLLLVAPWAMALQRSAGWEGLRECLVNNTVARFAGAPGGTRYGHSEPFGYYFGIAPVWLLPWTLALPAMAKSGLFRRETPGSDARRLLLATLVLGVLMLSAAASKRELYLLPLLPAWSVCVAGWLDGVGERQGREALDRRTLLSLAGFAVFLPLVLGLFGLGMAWGHHLPVAVRPLQTDLPATAFAGFGVAALVVGALLAAELVRRWRRAPSSGWVVASIILVVLGLETGVEALVDPVKRMDELTAAIAERFPGKGPVPAYLPPVVSNESIFGIIGFELGRNTLPLSTPEEVRRWLASHPGAPLLVRMEQLRRLPPDLRQGLTFLYDERGRKASPFGIAVWTGAGVSASRPAPPPPGGPA
jgi:4-amino-4-deoxy-L-arabinose transferase-like glycosyltransferase